MTDDLCQAPAGNEPDRTLDLPPSVPPLRAFYLYLTTGCNLHCRHCWIAPRFVDGVPSPGETLDLDALREAVAEARPMGLSGAKLTGGEPLLHPRLREIVELLSAEGLSLNMETNGVLMTPEMARFLKQDSAVGFVSVSLDGADAATHDALRGVAGSFEAALRGLDHLVAAGYGNVQVIISLHRGNRSHLEDVARLAAAHGAASVKINPVTAAGRGGAMHRQGETLDLDECLELDRFVREELRPRAGVAIVLSMPLALTPAKELWRTKGRIIECGVRGILGLLGSGEIAMCGIGRVVPELVYGRLGRDRIRDLWISHPTLLELRRVLEDVRQFPGICGECIHAAACRTGCVANNYVEGGQLVWPSTLCQEAEARGEFPVTRRRGFPAASWRFEGNDTQEGNHGEGPERH